MSDAFISADSACSTVDDYDVVVSAVRSLPDHSAADVTELASRVGAQKLKLINWVRTDLGFARLVASKVSE